MNVAKRIRAARDLHGWNRSDLARRAGLTPQAISRIERGESTEDKLAARTMVAIADATGVSIRWLVTGEGQMILPAHQMPEMALVAEIMASMSGAERELVIRFCRWTLDQRPQSRPNLTLVTSD